MGLCAAESTKKKKPFKTIIIPKGIINPNENNVIEIPLNLDANSSLIVKASSDPKSCLSVEPYQLGVLYNNADVKTIDAPSVPRKSNAFGNTDTMGNFGILECAGLMPNSACISNFGTIPTINTVGAIPAMNTVASTNFIPVTSLDFSTQTQCSWGNLPQSQPIVKQTISQNPDSHSPLCPICAQVSSKLCPSREMLRPNNCLLNPRYSQCPSLLANPCLTDTYSGGGYGRVSRPSYYPCDPFNFRLPTKSEILIKSSSNLRPQDENASLNKMVDDKLEKILKPLIMSLAKSFPEDEEREVYQKSLCSGPRYSRTYLEPQYSRECYYPRRSCIPDLDDVSIRVQTSYDRIYPRRSSSPESDYQNFKSNLKARQKYDGYFDGLPRRLGPDPVTITGGNMINPKMRDFASDMCRTRKYCYPEARRYNEGIVPKRKSRSSERETVCPTTTTCPKRTNVSFEPWRRSDASSGIHRTSSGVDLNKRITVQPDSDDSFETIS